MIASRPCLDAERGSSVRRAWVVGWLLSCCASLSGCTVESAACEADSECDDRVFCNGQERCVGGACQPASAPCPADEVACTDESCDERGRRCTTAFVPERCDDGDACTGRERCDARLGCTSSGPPTCDDGEACTDDACDPALGCVHVGRDADGDGAIALSCGGVDCLDTPGTGGAARPGLVEVCDDGIDNDCNGRLDDGEPSCPPTGDRCSMARHIAGAGTHAISLRGAARDHDAGCFSGWVDAVVLLDLSEASDLVLSARPVELGGGGPGSGIALRRAEDCAFGPEIVPPRCSVSTASGSSDLRAYGVAAGTVAIVLSGAPDATLALVVDISPASPPPVGATCASAEDVSAGGTFPFALAGLSDGWRVRCGSDGGDGDRTFVMTLTETRDVELSLSPPGTLGLSRSCGPDPAVVSCGAGVSFEAPAVLRRSSLPPGTYYVSAEPWPYDGESRPVSEAALTVRTASPLPRGCGAITDVGTLARGTSTARTVSLSGAVSDVGTGCPSRLPSEAALRFVLAESADVDLRVTGGSSLVQVSTSTECGALDRLVPSVRCAQGDRESTLVARALDAGTYYALVAGEPDDLLELQISTRPPSVLAPEDRCETAPLLSATDRRTVAWAGVGDDDPGARCLGARNAPEVFFSLSIAETSRVAIEASADAAAGALAIELRGHCDHGVIDAACGLFSPAASLTRVLDPGDYVLTVESDAAASVVTIDVSVTAEVGP